jgi:phenylalanyl-tRNA synthetase alpha chain
MDLKARINELKKQLDSDLNTNLDLDETYLKYFSKKHGLVTQLVRELPRLSETERKEMGPAINKLQSDYKTKIENARSEKKGDQIKDAGIDLTLPLPPGDSGYLHPTTQVIREMNKFFRYLGYSVYEGPEVETVEYNFEKLNLPKDHPATDLQDTLYVMEPDVLLRTHTSSIEARALTDLEPPIRIVSPGKSYRNETPNKSNSSFFFQYQGVVVDEGITLKHLKATLDQVHKFMFGEDTELRYRYKYYPEVSPGMGVDMKCKFCDGKGCDICKHTGWLEMLGSGMIHYNTLKMCGIDPEKYTGFAFGMGLDRHVMQKFGVEDIRKLYGGGVVYK